MASWLLLLKLLSTEYDAQEQVDDVAAGLGNHGLTPLPETIMGLAGGGPGSGADFDAMVLVTGEASAMAGFRAELIPDVETEVIAIAPLDAVEQALANWRGGTAPIAS